MPGEANVVAQTGSDGVLLVDGGSAAGSDALMKAVAALPGGGHGSHALQHALASRADRLQRAARHGRRHDYCPREHAALAAAKHHVALERTEIQEACPRSPNPTRPSTTKARSIPESATDTSPTRRTRTAICTFTSRSRTCWRWATPLYGQGWPVVDWWTGGWIGGIVGGLQRIQTRRERRYEDRSRARARAQLWPTSRRRSTCTARSTIV